MSVFIEWLESLNRKDTKVRAVLKRSLAFEPGTFPSVYPYVEPFVSSLDGYPREMHYLVAGLWAAHWQEGRSGAPVGLGTAAARHQMATGSDAIERRFIALLDADCDQLPHRLRQMVALLQEQSMDFNLMLADLLRWNHPGKRTQSQWARDFYRITAPATTNPEPVPSKES